MTEMIIDQLEAPTEQRGQGMLRFYSGQNMERYRKLASEIITPAERRQILEMLASEMAAFRHEVRKQTT